MEKIKQQIEKALSKRVYNERDKYIYEISKNKSHEVFDYLKEVARIGNADEKGIAIRCLAGYGVNPGKYKRETLKFFVSRLKEESNQEIISDLLFAIGQRSQYLSNSDLKFISNFKTHKSKDVRFGLAYALSGVDSSIALDTLIELTRDRAADVRDWSTFGIGTQSELDTKEIRDVLWARVEDRNYKVRSEAISGLVNRKVDGIKPVIRKNLENNDFDSLLLEIVEKIRAVEFIPLLEKIYNKYKDDESFKIGYIKYFESVLESLKKMKRKSSKN